MIKEKYIKRDTSEKIKIDLKNNFFIIGKEKQILDLEEKEAIIKLYKYDKEIFKEFIENIYTKYDFTIISFFIVNKITLEEIKKINNIVLFPLTFSSTISYFILSSYNINIIDLFKYLYSQPYELISDKLLYYYMVYIQEMHHENKLTKYNMFPTIYSFFEFYDREKIIRNDEKDIIKDIDDYHIEFYGSRCEYYITFEEEKYDLLNDKDRENLFAIIDSNDTFFYFSEYYESSNLETIVSSFKNKEYYTETIKENIFYILKDNYKYMIKKEIDKIQNVILKSKKRFYPIMENIFTNDFKKNLFFFNCLTNSNFFKNIKEIVKDKYMYNNKNLIFLNINFIYKFNLNKTNKIICKKDIEIKEINILEFINLINKNEYLDKKFSILHNTSIFLCTDKKTKDKLFIYKKNNDLKENYIIKFLNKEYSLNFLERIENLKI